MKILVDNRVREARKGLKLSQQQLGAMTGLSRQAIIAIEKKHIVPTIKNGLLIAQALHRSVDELFWIISSEDENDRGTAREGPDEGRKG